MYKIDTIFYESLYDESVVLSAPHWLRGTIRSKYIININQKTQRDIGILYRLKKLFILE